MVATNSNTPEMMAWITDLANEVDATLLELHVIYGYVDENASRPALAGAERVQGQIYALMMDLTYDNWLYSYTHGAVDLYPDPEEKEMCERYAEIVDFPVQSVIDALMTGRLDEHKLREYLEAQEAWPPEAAYSQPKLGVYKVLESIEHPFASAYRVLAEHIEHQDYDTGLAERHGYIAMDADDEIWLEYVPTEEYNEMWNDIAQFADPVAYLYNLEEAFVETLEGTQSDVERMRENFDMVSEYCRLTGSNKPHVLLYCAFHPSHIDHIKSVVRVLQEEGASVVKPRDAFEPFEFLTKDFVQKELTTLARDLEEGDGGELSEQHYTILRYLAHNLGFDELEKDKISLEVPEDAVRRAFTLLEASQLICHGVRTGLTDDEFDQLKHKILTGVMSISEVLGK
jgi:hypothetical protein